jgi:hypothetical protein
VLPTGLGNRAGILPGFDFRGRGGYVVGLRPFIQVVIVTAGSTHCSKSSLPRANPADLARQRLLVESLGGTYHEVVGRGQRVLPQWLKEIPPRT